MPKPLTESQFAASAYAVFLHLKVIADAEADQERVEAIKELLALAPESTKRSGVKVFGQIAGEM